MMLTPTLGTITSQTTIEYALIIGSLSLEICTYCHSYVIQSVQLVVRNCVHLMYRNVYGSYQHTILVAWYLVLS